jgi:hypothetical protein
MSEQKMDVFLLAAPQAGIEHLALVRNLAAVFKKDVSTIEKMLAHPRALVKSNVGQELAAKYKAAIEKAGGQCELLAHGEALFVAAQKSATATKVPQTQSSLIIEPVIPAVIDKSAQSKNDGRKRKLLIAAGVLFIALLSVLAILGFSMYRAKNSLDHLDTNLAQTLYSGDNYLSVKVPNNWSTKNLLSTALIGAANLLDENYVVVLQDSKEDAGKNITLDDYALKIQTQLMTNIKNAQVQVYTKQLSVGDLPAKQFIFFGVADGVKVAYIITVIETDKQFYRVMAWTLESNFGKNKKLLQDVSKSFRIN